MESIGATISNNLNDFLIVIKNKKATIFGIICFHIFSSDRLKILVNLSGPPDPPRNCSLTNQTADSLQIDCRQGFGSGLRQEFHMEVFTHPKHQLLVNITARSPRLLARGLPSDASLFLRVYASTAKGRSRSVTFEGYTLRMRAEKQTGECIS